MNNLDDLKAKKRELNITFEELAQKSGIPLRTIENIFHGVTKNPRIDTMQAIERALGLDAQAEPPTMPEEVRELAELIAQMTENEVKELSTFVDFILSKRK